MTDNELPYEGLARRYRPQTFDDVVGQRHVVGTLTKAIDNKRWAAAYLFIGGRGLGKTTMARLVAKSINCAGGPAAKTCGKCESCVEISGGRDIDVLEIDAASNTGVDNVRDTIIQAVSTAPVRGRAKIFIIDEVHMLSTAAFNALLKTIEEPPPGVLFILATTEGLKVPATIRSRCQRFDFRPVTFEELNERLKEIVQKEKISIDDATLRLIADFSEGGIRDALSALDLVRAYCSDVITIERAEEALGVVPSRTIDELLKAFDARNTGAALSCATETLNMGADPVEIMRGLLGAFRARLITGIESGAEPLGRIVKSLDTILDAMMRSRQGRHPRLELELLLTKLAELREREIELREIYEKIGSPNNPSTSARDQVDRIKKLFNAEIVEA